MLGKDHAYATIHSLPEPKLGDLAQHHADRCHGLPIFEQDGAGQYTARCAQGDFEVTGCDTRREAGARFYGGEQPGLYGAIGQSGASTDLTDRLLERARAIRAEVIGLQDKEEADGLGGMESKVLARLDIQYNLLGEFVDPDTGAVR